MRGLNGNWEAWIDFVLESLESTATAAESAITSSLTTPIWPSSAKAPNHSQQAGGLTAVRSTIRPTINQLPSLLRTNSPRDALLVELPGEDRRPSRSNQILPLAGCFQE
jgi:hypothetical protein